jgi:hypothetical protein
MLPTAELLRRTKSTKSVHLESRIPEKYSQDFVGCICHPIGESYFIQLRGHRMLIRYLQSARSRHCNLPTERDKQA